jgi:phosphoribosylanthranilate isomerase
MPIQTKICGLSTPETVDAALKGGASHIGLVFFPKSPRNVSADQAAALAARVGDRAQVVGLFVDPEPGFVASVQAQVGLHIIQLHGSESPAQVAAIRAAQRCEIWKAVPIKTRADVALAAAYQGAATHVLFDAKPPKGADLPGGTGMRFDWSLLSGVRQPLPWILAGGLDAGNLAEAVRVTGATVVDVSSGVESAPGIKDVDKIAAFLKAAREL